MASEGQIRQAFGVLGGLYAAEHAEGDDKGAQQVNRLLRHLRRFSKHEQAEHAQPEPPVNGWGT